MASDKTYMRRALELAQRGAGWVNPNPQVGCVIVKDDRVIGEGWHTAYGRLHAEREALAACSEDPKGATAYVTLEPCCHHGKTPPCTEGLIEAGIARVVMGAPDPNPLVAGKGVEALRQAGIEVTEGVLVDECLAINEAWFHYIQTKRPHVTAKFACTLDGKIGLRPGETCWLTGEEARERTHEDRHKAAAIVVGIGTVIADDPMLTCRLGDPVKQPVRVVVDSQLRIPLDSQLVRTANASPVVVATTQSAPIAKMYSLRDAGVDVLILPSDNGLVDLVELLDELGRRGVDSLILEGGPTLHAAFFRAGLINSVQAYLAPCVFGGQQTPGAIGSLGLDLAKQAPQLQFTKVTALGRDVLLEGEVL